MRYIIAFFCGLVILAGCSSSPTDNPSAPSVTPQPVAPPPQSIDIPSIGAHSSLIPVGLKSDGTMDTPPLDHPEQAAWYTGSPVPGQIGPSVVIGHINGDGHQGIFANLNKVHVGDKVTAGTATFTVRRVAEFSKDNFPYDQVYGNTPDPELRLITCGGALNRAEHSYLDNIVVFAS